MGHRARMIDLTNIEKGHYFLVFGRELNLIDEMFLAVLDSAVAGVVGTDGAEQNSNESQFDDKSRRDKQVVQETIFP